jgi:hypothetical protein
MRVTMIRAIAALCLLATAAAVPASASSGKAGTAKCTTTKPKAHHTLRTATAAPAVSLGATGGNMVPWSVTIAGDGAITGNGWNKPKYAQLNDPKDALPALYKLADTENFWSMPSFTNCSGTLPDIASLYLEINSSTGTRRVTVHGGCKANFNQMLAVIEDAVGLGRAGTA